MSDTANTQPFLFLNRWTMRQVAIVLFIAVFLLNAFGTWNLPLLYNDEARFTEASREMRQRDDWVVPYFNNEFRFDKPPLIYWLQAPALALLGENEFAARLHSILAGATLAVIILYFGARVYHPVAGFWAAVIFSTSFRVMAQGKGATSDMLLTLFVTLAFWAGWELTREREPERITALRSRWWWIFYVSLALAFLAKGPLGWMPLLALPLYVWWAKPAALNARFRFELGVPLMLALVALWAVPAMLRTHGDFLRVGIGEHVVTRMTKGLDGHGPSNFWLYLLQSPFYLVTLFTSFGGWCIWFPWCFKSLRAEKFGGATERFFLSGIILTYVVLTLGWSRRPHYTMPVFPLIALVFASVWWRSGRAARPLARMGVSLAVISTVFTLAAMLIVPLLVPGRELVKQCAPSLRRESAFATVGLTQASLVWYFRQHVHDFRRLLGPDEAVAFMAQPGPRFCVMTREIAEEKFPALPKDWRRIDASGAGYYSGTPKKMFLTVLIKP
jgi:4-amino-4-deoxy-L-arabinose transferase-like glycosyltransferase